MKIKIALLDTDTHYLDRIAAVFGAKYGDKLEVYSFTKEDLALDSIGRNKIDVLIASDSFEVDTATLPKRCGFAYFVENHDIQTVREEQAICKFQKTELIYKQIVSIYSEKAEAVSGIGFSDENGSIIGFVSPCGGVGTSTMAAAYAVSCAQRGQGVFYLNLETFGSADTFFAAEGQFNMSDIIYSLKSRKANLPLKIESCIKQDSTGVYFFSQSKAALDMMELGTEEILALIRGLQLSGRFQAVVIDMRFALDEETLKLYQYMKQIVMVNDGTEISNAKLFRAYEALMMLEQGMDVSLAGKMSVICNKFSNKTGSLPQGIDLKVIGGAPRYERASAKQIVSQIAGMDIFTKLL